MSTTWPNEPATGGTVRLDHDFSTVLGPGMSDPYNTAGLASSQPTAGTLTRRTDGTAPVSPGSCIVSAIPAGAKGGGTELHWYDSAVRESMYVGMTWRTNAGFQLRTTANKMWFMRGPGVNGFFGIVSFNAGTTNNFPVFIGFGHNTGSLDNSHAMAGDLGLIGNPNVTAVPINANAWTKLEAYIKKSTTSTSRDGIVRWWVNGILCGNYTNINYAPNGLNEWVWSETWDGTVNNPVPSTQWEHWLDHLYIVTDGTGSGGSGGGGGGGGGGTPQILPAPTGLYPNGVTLPYGPTTFQWNTVPGAVEYKLRVHVGGMPYDPPTPPNFLTVEDLSATSRQLTTAPSSTYDWWIHSENSAGDFGPSNGASFSTTASPEPPPPNPDPPPDPPPTPPVEPPVDPPPPVVVPPPVDPTDPTTLPPDPLPQPQVLGTATVIVTIKDRQNPIKKEFHFYG